MSVTSVSVVNTGRKGSWTWEQKREYTIPLLVECSAFTDGQALVFTYLQSNGYALGSTYVGAGGTETDTGSILTDLSFDQRSGASKKWDVVAKYSSHVDTKGKDPTSVPKDPTSQAAIIKCAFANNTEYRTKDLDDTDACNSAGQPFEDGIQIDVSTQIITIEKKVASVSNTTIAGLNNTLNSASFLGFASNTLRMNGITYEPVTENNQAIWKITYTIAVVPDYASGKTWLEVGASLDQGYYYLDADNKLTPALLRGIPVSSPILLDGSGGKLAMPGGTPTYITFTRWKTVSWASVPTS